MKSEIIIIFIIKDEKKLVNETKNSNQFKVGYKSEKNNE